jgi:hypothetical protein
MRATRLVALAALLALAAPGGGAAEPAADTCPTQKALLEKRLAFLQQRLQQLEHELASRPRPDADREAWRDPGTWHSLRNGMSEAEVLRILGAPGRVTGYYGFVRWEYPDALGARVDFDERGRLIAWGALAR